MRALLVISIALASFCTGQRIHTVEVGNSRYYISNASPYSAQLNWFLAYQYCRTIGMELLTFERHEEVEILHEYLRENSYDRSEYWTSGNQLGSNMWIWMSSGQPYNTTFSFWPAAGPPLTKSDQSCMSTQGRVWTAKNCMDGKAFICEQTRCFFYNYVTSNRQTHQQGNVTITPGVSRIANGSTQQDTAQFVKIMPTANPHFLKSMPTTTPIPLKSMPTTPIPLKSMPTEMPLKFMPTAQTTLKSMPTEMPLKFMPTSTIKSMPLEPADTTLVPDAQNNEIQRVPILPFQLLQPPKFEFSPPAPPQTDTQTNSSTTTTTTTTTTPSPGALSLSRKETFSWALLDGSH